MPLHLGIRDKARRLLRSRDSSRGQPSDPAVPLDPTKPTRPDRTTTENVEDTDLEASAVEDTRLATEDRTPVPPGVEPILKGTNIGLTTLYEPEGSSKAVVDIIFVHGLMGNAYTTWYNEDSMIHWPSTLLKDDIKTARILAFGYDADVASFWGGAAQNRISNHASNMIGHIVGLREETDSEERRIIFVVHSLGGLVTERALSMSENHAEEHLRQVEACTVGILFLGTPHHGSGLAPFAKSVAKVIKAVGKRVNTEILEILKRDSQVLLDVEEWFAQWLRRRAKAGTSVDITCFFEEMELPGVGKVVSEDSATVSGYATYSIHADHMGMTKFAAANDPGYIAIHREIRRWVRRLQAQATTVSTEWAMTDVQEECLRSLHFQELSNREDSVNGPLPDTLVWIWTRRKLGFRKWLQGGRGIFWISGKPGSGKSTMIKYLRGDPELVRALTHSGDVEEPIIVAYFLDVKGSALARSMEGLLRSLLWQILQQRIVLFKAILPKFIGMKRLQKGITWSLQDLKDVFRLVLHHAAPYRLCILIDALDEYSGEHIQIAEYFDNLSFDLSNIRLCLASRPYPDFSYQFRDCLSIRMEEQTTLDIQEYTRRRFQHVLAEEGSSYQQLIDKVIAKADGVFLWVERVCDALLRGWRRREDLSRLLQRLEDMPVELKALYRRILDELEDEERREAYRMLSIISCAMRPLSLVEFFYACEGWTGDPMIRPSYHEEITKFDGRIAALCGGLLEHRQDGLRPSHETVFAFMNSIEDEIRGQLKVMNGNVYLLRASVQALSMHSKVIRSHHRTEKRPSREAVSWVSRCDQRHPGMPSTDQEKIQFLGYAATYWIPHALLCEKELQASQAHILNRLTDFDIIHWQQWKVARKHRDSSSELGEALSYTKQYETLLEVAIEHKLNFYCVGELRGGGVGTSGSSNTPSIRSPGRLLFAAALNGDVEIARLLFKSGVHFEQGDPFATAALHRAIFYNNNAVVETFLHHKADPNCAATLPYQPLYFSATTPLEVAIDVRNPEAIRLLLIAGADPNNITTEPLCRALRLWLLDQGYEVGIDWKMSTKSSIIALIEGGARVSPERLLEVVGDRKTVDMTSAGRMTSSYDSLPSAGGGCDELPSAGLYGQLTDREVLGTNPRYSGMVNPYNYTPLFPEFLETDGPKSPTADTVARKHTSGSSSTNPFPEFFETVSEFLETDGPKSPTADTVAGRHTSGSSSTNSRDGISAYALRPLDPDQRALIYRVDLGDRRSRYSDPGQQRDCSEDSSLDQKDASSDVETLVHMPIRIPDSDLQPWWQWRSEMENPSDSNTSEFSNSPTPQDELSVSQTGNGLNGRGYIIIKNSTPKGLRSNKSADSIEESRRGVFKEHYKADASAFHGRYPELVSFSGRTHYGLRRWAILVKRNGKSRNRGEDIIVSGRGYRDRLRLRLPPQAALLGLRQTDRPSQQSAVGSVSSTEASLPGLRPWRRLGAVGSVRSTEAALLGLRQEDRHFRLLIEAAGLAAGRIGRRESWGNTRMERYLSVALGIERPTRWGDPVEESNLEDLSSTCSGSLSSFREYMDLMGMSPPLKSNPMGETRSEIEARPRRLRGIV